MANIWLKIWLKVKENGTKKIKLAKMVAKEKEILVRTLKGGQQGEGGWGGGGGIPAVVQHCLSRPWSYSIQVLLSNTQL